MAVLVSAPPCVVYEDEHLLVASKPAGLNTHAPSPHAGEGLHEWLKNRERKWASLAIVHRLDKVTSGLIIFAKSKAANQSLTQQFATRGVRKRYLLLTSAAPAEKTFAVNTLISRLGDKYFANDKSGEPAETNFVYVSEHHGRHLVAAYPVTGRTHQIRVHAAFKGLPILGDETYGGEPFPRVCLHAEEISLQHPVTREPLRFQASADFEVSPEVALRDALIEPGGTNAYRLVHGGSDGVSIDRWGDWLLVESERGPAKSPAFAAAGVYFKALKKQVQPGTIQESSPEFVSGEPAPETFAVLENGVRYEISFNQGYSVGLFLDQRENRRRLLTSYIVSGFEIPGGLRGKEVLNTFAYTCGFSVCAALAGARCVSLDLSKKYLEWGQRNFRLNQMDPAAHEFIFGDVFDWVPRLQKKGRQFDLIILDPPTFSRSKIGGAFQAERDYGRLAKLVLPLLRRGGVLFASTNAHKLAPEDFRAQVTQAIRSAGRSVAREHYVPQPFDFPISKSEPAHLKTIWVRVD
jgi:23S rRNA (cytosine1962-C5)-methyltransferase